MSDRDFECCNGLFVDDILMHSCNQRPADWTTHNHGVVVRLLSPTGTLTHFLGRQSKDTISSPNAIRRTITSRSLLRVDRWMRPKIGLKREAYQLVYLSETRATQPENFELWFSFILLSLHIRRLQVNRARRVQPIKAVKCCNFRQNNSRVALTMRAGAMILAPVLSILNNFAADRMHLVTLFVM